MEGETIAIVDSRPGRVLGRVTWGKLRLRAISISFRPTFGLRRFVHLESYYRSRAFLEISQATLRGRSKCITRLFLSALPSISPARFTPTTMTATLPLFRRPRDQVDDAVSDVTARRYAKMDFELPDYYRPRKSLRVLARVMPKRNRPWESFIRSNLHFSFYSNHVIKTNIFSNRNFQSNLRRTMSRNDGNPFREILATVI